MRRTLVPRREHLATQVAGRRRVPARGRVISAAAAFCGAVFLALALAVPETVEGGAPFPDRDLIVFVTAGVIVVTLAQCLLLPSVVRWARVPEDATPADERRLAETLGTEAAYDALPGLATELRTEPAVVERTRQEFDDLLAALRAQSRAGELSAPPGRAVRRPPPRPAVPQARHAYATNGASTTPCSARSRHSSTSRSSGSRGEKSLTDQATRTRPRR